jgi:hypothetical protein
MVSKHRLSKGKAINALVRQMNPGIAKIKPLGTLYELSSRVRTCWLVVIEP